MESRTQAEIPLLPPENVTGGTKPRVLCLHGFRTSGEIMRTQVTGKWPSSVTGQLDLVFLDAPLPALGKSEVEAIFPPPYYEWYQFNKETLEYSNFDECLEYVEKFMIMNGPFDGLMGFSRGATLSAAMVGMQAKGLTLTRVPKIKFVVIIEGGRLMSPFLQEKAYSAKINCPSVHFIGDTDYLRPQSEVLLKTFVQPVLISHPKGHIVPRLDERGLEKMLNFLERVKSDLQGKGSEVEANKNLI